MTIPNQPPPELSQDFFGLRDEAVATLQQLAGDTWTDHNLHDPGITMLEAMCFAISDLGYRLDFAIEDLLAKADAGEPDAFPKAEAMLSCQPVTANDYRRLILDIDGVRNTLVEQRQSGLWQVQVIPDSILDSDERKQALAREVRRVFLAHRNLGEDLDTLQVMPTYSAVVQVNIDLDSNADPVESLAQIYNQLANIIAPQVRFYSLDELERNGHLREHLHTGPWLERGYLPDSELERPALVERVYVSDLMTRVLEHDGVNDLIELKIASTAAPTPDNFEDWVFTPLTGMAPVLDIENTLNYLTASKNGTPINIPRERLVSRYQELRFGQPCPGRSELWQNPGRYRNLGDYLTLQHELPAIYGVGAMGLAPGASARTISDVRQLQAYLLLFDQVLGNQFAQLDHLRTLLGQPRQDWLDALGLLLEKMLNSANLSDAEQSQFWQSLRLIPHSHVTQPVDQIHPDTDKGIDLQELPRILKGHDKDYFSPKLQALTEAPFSRSQLQRLSRAGDHLLARSHEQMPDAAQLRYEEVFSHYASSLLVNRHARAFKEEMQARNNGIAMDDDALADELTQRMALLKEAADRALFMRDLVLSGERSQGIDYTSHRIWGGGNLSGLRQRIYRRLGLATLASDTLATHNTEGFHLVEDTLLRHGLPIGNDTEPRVNDIYLVVPDWPSRFADPDFNELFRRTVEQELPVHLQPQWLTLGRDAMADFEKVYNAWRNAMTRLPGEHTLQPEEEQDYRRNLVKRLSSYLRQFILSDGTEDISGWDIDPLTINSPDAVIGQWAIGYNVVTPLNYNPDPEISDHGKLGKAEIGGEDNPFFIHIAPAHPLHDEDS